jgi:hypothetical protein
MATLAELQLELTEIKQAISNILKGGQSYTINAGQGGSSRTVTQADYAQLITDKIRIESQIANLNGGRGFRMRPGW